MSEPASTYKSKAAAKGQNAPADSAELERLNGSVERITFHSEESGFCVLKVKVQNRKDLVTVTGAAAAITTGEFIECLGVWINDKNYGLQFKAQNLVVVAPTTLEGIEKYLGSGMIKGIGPHYAKKMVEAFGAEVFDVIETDPDRLSSLPRFGKKRVEKVVAAWGEQRAIREIMVFLQSYGVGTSRSVRIYRTYGDQAIALVSENPYRLSSDIHGIGFKSADQIAQKIGIPRDSLIRAQAGVRYALQELASEGNCAYEKSSLRQKTCELLEILPPLAEEAIGEELRVGNLVSEKIEDRELVYLSSLYKSERGVVENLLRLVEGESPWAVVDAKQAIPWVENKAKIQLSDSQKRAIELALKSKVLVITGGPGVGKTTIVNSILQIMSAKQAKISLCAPTGRAAKRLSESTGMEAKTIHRLLEFDPKIRGFKRNKDNRIETNVLVVDESSMIDIVLMNQLMSAIPDNAVVILVGDVDQLPSVGPGTVLSSVIESGVIETVRLTEIFRQAASSKIIVNAHRINKGQMPLKQEKQDELVDFYLVPAETPEEINKKLIQIVQERIPKRFGLDPVKDIQVLAPMNRGSLGAHSLNAELQKKLNPKPEVQISKFGTVFAPGDKVLQTINNYDKEVFNGDIGRIESIDMEEQEALVDFDGRTILYDFNELDELSLAYSTSIHKSQGSEYPAVVIPLAMQHFMMLERNLLYTAVTRGKKLVVIVGQAKALAMAVKNLRSNERVSALSYRLQHA